ncbi:potassium-transporting ATPase subunit KdpC [Sphingobacterium sp. WM]|uniref:potassium-transporting ATPase subunit KdpC n=1 Tax=Sphingobacterium sp. WM TaxID=3031802 RepID=UPI00240D9055|nr:potassium-transporting ATPase subunit KdpC [Sphingobacterium sp. WM]WFB65185.1 potassium-transporting ATPase subunit KdpC [Sphingobacterium sp. WM]
MKAHLLPALKMTVLTFVLFAIVYPFVVWAIAQLSPNQGKGFVIEANGKTYYKNIGQKFTDDKYFWSRPSAVEYDAAGSGASNNAGSNPEYIQEVEGRITHFLSQNPKVNREQIPTEIVTASGSGLDPHLSVNALEIQVPRIAQLRGLEEPELIDLITEHTEQPLWGMFGPKKVNVLELNLALDALATEKGVQNAQ